MLNLNNNHNYTVIIGDIIDSKSIKNRKEVQHKFKEVLYVINKKYRGDIASKFAITLGDEFQGLLKNKNNIINIIVEIQMAMSPLKLRFGVGIGHITTDIELNHSSEIDGPAYHRARKMVEGLKASESQYQKRDADILIASNESDFETTNLLNSILSVCAALKSKWTKRQVEVIYTYLLNDENQYKTADKLNVGQSSVNKVLNSSKFYSYKAAMDSVNMYLANKEVKDDE